MPNATPTHRYYRHAEGSWFGGMEATVTGFGELKAAVGFLNAFSMWMMSVWPNWLGRLRLKTTVSFEDKTKQVAHTTTVTWCGLPMMKSVERVILDDDGKHFTLEGSARITMMPWTAYPVIGGGHVDEEAAIANYEVSWFGTTLNQVTNMQADTITLSQRAAGFEGSQMLKRQTPLE